MRSKLLLAVQIATIFLLYVYVWVENHPPRLTLAQCRAVKVGMTSDEVERQIGVPPGGYACRGGRQGGTFTNTEVEEIERFTAIGDAVWFTRYHKLIVRYGDDHRVSEVRLSKRGSFHDWLVEQQRGHPISEDDFLDFEQEQDRYSWKSLADGWRRIW